MDAHLKKLKTYDVVAILCAGLAKDGQDYVPTAFGDSDEFGMLGGYVRVDAAVELAKSRVSSNFLFSTGVSAKQIEKFGKDVPPEAHIYRDVFLDRLGAERRVDAVNIFLEDTSVNTVGNIQAILQLCIDNNWSHIALLSSEYHIPRIRALVNLVLDQYALNLSFDFLSAETILRTAHPRLHDAYFDNAYSTPEAKKRIANEAQGLIALENGNYVLGEFQLSR